MGRKLRVTDMCISGIFQTFQQVKKEALCEVPLFTRSEPLRMTKINCRMLTDDVIYASGVHSICLEQLTSLTTVLLPTLISILAILTVPPRWISIVSQFVS